MAAPNPGIIDNERFILEVRNRPAIWDKNAVEHLDTELKKRCWTEILHIFFTKPGLTERELKSYANFLQQRWEIMKNEFLSEYHQRLSYTKSGIVLNDQPPYKYQYFKQLLFLQPVLPVNPNSSNTPQEKHDDVNEIINVLRTGFKQRTDAEMAKENDGDRLFLLSLLNSMKKVPDRLNLSVRMQIMQAIDNVCSLDASSQRLNRTIGMPKRQHPENPNVLMLPKKKKKVDQVSIDVKEAVNELRMGFQQRMDVEMARENDADRHFLLSILNSMKKVPESLKLSVKVQIMQVIDNACRVDFSATQGYTRSEVIDNASRIDFSPIPGCSGTGKKTQRQDASQRPAAAGSPGTTASRHTSFSSSDSDNA